jgi:hypothetical protein
LLIFGVVKGRRDYGQICVLRGNLRLSLPFIEAWNKTGIEPSVDEFLVSNDLAKERQRRRDSANLVLVERAPQPINRFRARTAPNREFRNHRIVMNRNFRQPPHAAVDPDARAKRFP